MGMGRAIEECIRIQWEGLLGVFGCFSSLFFVKLSFC